MIKTVPNESKTLLSVLCNHEGQPVAFVHQGQQYLVSSKPIRWYKRRSWWVDFESANRDTPTAIELEIWRLRASCKDRTGFFELEHLQPEDEWRLLRVMQE